MQELREEIELIGEVFVPLQVLLQGHAVDLNMLKSVCWADWVLHNMRIALDELQCTVTAGIHKILHNFASTMEVIQGLIQFGEHLITAFVSYIAS